METNLRTDDDPALHDAADDWCDVPPLGWRCTRAKGHTGPCAAVACPDDVALVARGMMRLRETPNALGEGRERGILREASSGEAAASTDGVCRT